ncbi:hypothetical protein [Methyloglobulus sp.]|uniref:hypothetical protein n=1 Tax=Methyloglobulus sp. TaxID=2518622 RepID=UPI003988C75B
MQITPYLEKKIAQAVQTSMLIEGYKKGCSQTIKAQAKNLMKQYRVQLSVPRKGLTKIEDSQ